MKAFTGTVTAVMLLVSVVAVSPQPSPLMKILIKPGVMSETIGKGDVALIMTFPTVNTIAGAPLVSLSTMVPGSSKPQEINGLTATDAFRPLSQESRNLGGTRQWNSTPALKGESAPRYVALVENAPMIQGRPPMAPRIDGDSFSIIGSTFLLRPRIEFPYRFAISWDLSAMGTGAAAVCSYVEAALPRLDLGGGNHEMASMPRAQTND